MVASKGGKGMGGCETYFPSGKFQNSDILRQTECVLCSIISTRNVLYFIRMMSGYVKEERQVCIHMPMRNVYPSMYAATYLNSSRIFQGVL